MLCEPASLPWLSRDRRIARLMASSSSISSTLVGVLGGSLGARGACLALNAWMLCEDADFKFLSQCSFEKTPASYKDDRYSI
jgi:hypothetical protein